MVDHEGDVLYLRLEPLSWGQEIRNYPTINVVGRYLVATCKAAADSDLRLSNDIKLADLTVELSILEGEPVDARGKRLERGIGDVYLREGIDPFISVCFYSNRTVTLRSGSKSEMEVMQAAKLQLA